MKHWKPTFWNIATHLVCCALVVMLIPIVASPSAWQCNCQADSEQPPLSSCSTELEATKNACCCNPEATEGNCSDCACNESGESIPIVPAIPPTHQSVEFVFTGLVAGIEEEIHWPPLDEIIWSTIGQEFNSVHTSQHTCVILSRFTC